MDKISDKIKVKLLKNIKDRLEEEILKRGVNAKIDEIELDDSKKGYERINFSTENFQTSPVMFKELCITNFSSSLNYKDVERSDKTRFTYLEIWIQVYYSYKHFGGGSNGCTIFDFSAKCDLEDGSLYSVIPK